MIMLIATIYFSLLLPALILDQHRNKSYEESFKHVVVSLKTKTSTTIHIQTFNHNKIWALQKM